MTAGIVAITGPDSEGELRELAAWLRRCREARVSLKVKRSGAAEELELDCGPASDAEQVLGAVRGFLDKA